MCDALKVSRSGYYDWKNRSESKRAIRDKNLLKHIRRVHTQSREHYGIPNAGNSSMQRVFNVVVIASLVCVVKMVFMLRDANDLL